VSLRDVPDLNAVEVDGDSLKLGAGCTFNDIISSEHVNAHIPILAEVSRGIASHQVRNRATLGGNICNAAPSADSAPILMAMNAKCHIFSTSGRREMPLEEFFRGPGATALNPGEILTYVTVGTPSPGSKFAYMKHKVRETLEIAITGVAVGLTATADGSCADARVVVGACAPVPLRITSAEKFLKGTKLEGPDIQRAAEAAAAAISPIDDVRGSAWYRREMTALCLRRAIGKAMVGVGP
jgi:carbon-monoxide dehydrogenase medium subunit